MKKLMIALAAVAMAAGVQAAQVDWKVTVNSAYSGMQLYAINAAGLEGKDLTKLALTDLTSNNYTWYAGEDAAAKQSTLLYTKSSKGTPTETTTLGHNGTTASDLYFIVVDSENNQYGVINETALDTSAYQYEPGSTGTKYTYGQTTAVTMYKFAGDVPEPTSAMLMLLGVAGLALRRRRA